MRDETEVVIGALRADARATPERIAVMTGLDERAVHEEIAALESEGVIRGYRLVTDPERLRAITGAETVTAIIDVSVSPERGEGYDSIAARIARFPEVRSVCLVSGGQDLRCEVEGASMAAVADFVARKVATLEQVTHTATHFVMKQYKSDGVLFDRAVMDHRQKVMP